MLFRNESDGKIYKVVDRIYAYGRKQGNNTHYIKLELLDNPGYIYEYDIRDLVRDHTRDVVSFCYDSSGITTRFIRIQ